MLNLKIKKTTLTLLASALILSSCNGSDESYSSSLSKINISDFPASEDRSVLDDDSFGEYEDDISDTSSDNVSDDLSDDLSDHASNDSSANVSDNQSDDLTKDISDNSSENNSVGSSDNASDEPPNDGSGDSSDTPSSDISEDISNDPALFPKVTIASAGERYADKFTSGEVISTDNLYQSENVYVSFEEVTFEGKLYFVQDIYIKNIESFSVGFAGGSFGKKYNDYVLNMVKTYTEKGEKVVSAVNGDYCGLDGKGAIIRNGVFYGTGVAQYTICVLYKNGVMVTMSKDKFNAEKELEKGAWHAWDFGPSFLESDGSPVTNFTERLSIKNSNPRTVIGYYEPGHYCLVVAGGRAKGASYGVSFTQVSRFMSSLGCKIAYNLDGGKSSVMVFGEKISNEKYQGNGRRISDIVYIKDIQVE